MYNFIQLSAYLCKVYYNGWENKSGRWPLVDTYRVATIPIMVPMPIATSKHPRLSS